jgi:hypothetical protein
VKDCQQNKNIFSRLFQRTPSNGTSFASVWIGAQLTDWSGAGTVELVSHGPTITKDTYYWW